jgi:hypothetical protein
MLINTRVGSHRVKSLHTAAVNKSCFSLLNSRIRISHPISFGWETSFASLHTEMNETATESRLLLHSAIQRLTYCIRHSAEDKRLLLHSAIQRLTYCIWHSAEDKRLLLHSAIQRLTYCIQRKTNARMQSTDLEVGCSNAGRGPTASGVHRK